MAVAFSMSRDLDELLRDQRPAQRRGQRISLFVHRVGLQRRQDVVAGKLLAHIQHMAADRACGHRALANLVELASLPEIERDGDHLGAVLLLQPGNGDRRVEPA